MRICLMVAAAALTAGCAATLPSSPPLPASGATYRALGTEPFWALELNGREMVFTEAGGRRVAEAQPTPIHGFAGDIYQGKRINLNIVHGAGCSDGMSDRTYPDKVQLRVDDQSFQGCGGEPRPQASLAGSRWSVLSVGAGSTSGERFIMSFEGDRLSAQFGCNRLSGSYRVEGETLTVGPLASTHMACPDMRAEQAATAILQAPMRMTWTRGLDLLLQGAADGILLRRAR